MIIEAGASPISNLQKAAIRRITEEGYAYPKVLPNGLIACVNRFLFTDAIILVNPAAADFGYEDRWCYEHGKALPALLAWSGDKEPEGWHRHPLTGRRRPHGDASKEYIEA